MTTTSHGTDRVSSPRVELLDEEMIQVLSAKTGAERLAIAAGCLMEQDELLRRVVETLERRVRPADDYEATFASPEDVIVKKMQFYAEGGSDKHLRDIAGVLRISASRVDRDYVAAWADRLGLRALWDQILSQIRPAFRRKRRRQSVLQPDPEHQAADPPPRTSVSRNSAKKPRVKSRASSGPDPERVRIV